ncbi:MAG: hypothetical protein ACOCSD_07470 [Halolamina sp.]
MTPERLPLAIVAFLGLVAIVPAWVHFVGVYAPDMPAESAWIARFSLPAVALLFAGSWLGGDL